MSIKRNWKLYLRSWLVVVILMSSGVAAIPSLSKSVLAASAVQNLFYDLATDSLSDWTPVYYGASRTGIRIESSGNTLWYYRNDLDIDNHKAFQIEAVVSGSELVADEELGPRMWVKFYDDGIPPGDCRYIEVHFIIRGGLPQIALFDGNSGYYMAYLDKDWTKTSPRLRIRIKRQEVSGTDYILLQAEESSSWDNPAQPNALNTVNSQAVAVELFYVAPGDSEIGFGNRVAGTYYSDWESIHLTVCNDATTVLPYWPATPPVPTLVHDDKGMDSPQGIDFSCDLTNSGYLTNDSVTPVLDANGTTYYGETGLNPGNEAWDFDDLNDDQTVYGRVVVTDISGRSTIGPDGTTIIPNRTTPTVPQIDDILMLFDESVASGSLVGDGPGNSAKGRLSALRNMIEATGDLIKQGCLTEARQQLQDAYNRIDGQPNSPDFAKGPAAAELAEMIQKLINSL
jgi:hypothetical protein